MSVRSCVSNYKFISKDQKSYERRGDRRERNRSHAQKRYGDLWSGEGSYGIVVEAMSGDVAALAGTSIFRDSESTLLGMLRHVMLGLEHMHSKRFVHADLKADNVLYLLEGECYTFKLTDFGCSAFLEDGESHRTVCRTCLVCSIFNIIVIIVLHP